MTSNFNDNLKPTRPGFTLVELLFVIAIIAVLGALSAGILGKARKDAQISATQSRITQIEAIMQTVMEDFEVRRMPFRNSELPENLTLTAVRNLRRQIVAGMILAEYPSDDASLGQWQLPGDASFLSNRRTAEMLYWGSLTGADVPDQPGEFLHLILSRIDIDGISALESLGPNVVGDPDGDGLLDIVDAFGDSMALVAVQDTGSQLLTPLDPTTVPPSLPINEIRFKAVSSTLEEIEPTVEVSQ